MKYLLMCLSLITFAQSAIAEPKFRRELDQVTMTLTAKQWVNTDTAVLSVLVNATLKDADMVKARSDIMTQLQSIAKGDWHITQFNRSQDSSGLDKLNVSAQIRVKQDTLSQVYQLAKSVSKPGISYRVNQINFEPGLSDIEKGKVKLREALYQQVTAEIEQLNKQYPKQRYSVYRLFFFEPGQQVQMPAAKNMNERAMVLSTLAKAPGGSVSNEVQMIVVVILASERTTGKS